MKSMNHIKCKYYHVFSSSVDGHYDENFLFENYYLAQLNSEIEYKDNYYIVSQITYLHSIDVIEIYVELKKP